MFFLSYNRHWHFSFKKKTIKPLSCFVTQNNYTVIVIARKYDKNDKYVWNNKCMSSSDISMKVSETHVVTLLSQVAQHAQHMPHKSSQMVLWARKDLALT